MVKIYVLEDESGGLWGAVKDIYKACDEQKRLEADYGRKFNVVTVTLIDADN